MSEVEIEYCTECNFLPQALRTSERLLKQHHDVIEDVKLKPGPKGVFKVRVDDKEVWNKGIDNFDVGDVERSVRPELPTETSPVS